MDTPKPHWVGTYAEGEGRGIYRAEWAPAPALRPVAPLQNASWLAPTPDGLVLACSELGQASGAAESLLQVYRAGGGGALQPLAAAGTGGFLACHIGYAPGRRLAAVANYGSGSVALFRLAPGGLQALKSIDLAGLKGNAKRSHAHCCVFTRDESTLLVCDLGQDVIFRFTVENDEAQPAGETAMPAGSGPRHLVLSGDESLAYVACELNNELAVLRLEDGAVLQRHPLAAGFDGFAAAAAVKLAPDGRTLAVSCRGNDAVVLFALDADGLAAETARLATGAWPRDIAFTADGRWLLAACEKGNAVQVFDGAGNWQPRPEMALGLSAPVCLLEETAQ